VSVCVCVCVCSGIRLLRKPSAATFEELGISGHKPTRKQELLDAIRQYVRDETGVVDAEGESEPATPRRQASVTAEKSSTGRRGKGAVVVRWRERTRSCSLANAAATQSPVVDKAAASPEAASPAAAVAVAAAAEDHAAPAAPVAETPAPAPAAAVVEHVHSAVKSLASQQLLLFFLSLEMVSMLLADTQEFPLWVRGVCMIHVCVLRSLIARCAQDKYENTKFLSLFAAWSAIFFFFPLIFASA
jgi:hypothetical protein